MPRLCVGGCGALRAGRVTPALRPAAPQDRAGPGATLRDANL